jgi:uncharacterized membrane protein
VSVLIANAYLDEHRAAEVLATLQRLRAPEGDGLTNAAVVVRHLDGLITLRQSQVLSGAEAGHRDLWDALTALLVLAPPAPAGAGQELSAALARLEAQGVGESFAVQLCARLPPASSAVWLVAGDASLRAIVDLLRPFGSPPPSGTPCATSSTTSRTSPSTPPP